MIRIKTYSIFNVNLKQCKRFIFYTCTGHRYIAESTIKQSIPWLFKIHTSKTHTIFSGLTHLPTSQESWPPCQRVSLCYKSSFELMFHFTFKYCRIINNNNKKDVLIKIISRSSFSNNQSSFIADH